MCQENNSYKAQCPQCSAALYVSGTSEAYKFNCLYKQY